MVYHRYLSLKAALLGGLFALAPLACEERGHPGAIGGRLPGDVVGSHIDRCALPNEGCPCPNEGSVVDCGSVKETFEDYLTCSMGMRTCSNGTWGACVADRVTVKESSSTGSHTLALGSQAGCAAGGVNDPCDPYCNVTADTPTGLDAGTNFSTDGGLALLATGAAACTTLTLTPSSSTVTVTAFTSPPTLSPTAPVTFTLTAGPPGCVAAPFPTSWALDRVDLAYIAGDNNANGNLTIAVPVAGPIQVTAYAVGLSAKTTVTAKVNVVEAPTSNAAATPNDAAATSSPYAAINAFSSIANACAPSVTNNCRNSPNVPATPSTATFLYPYADTYLPLGLPAPWLQYLYASASTAGVVKASLRYPENLGATDANTLFNYSLIVAERNGAARTYASTFVTSNSLDPQVVIPQQAWAYFERSARGQNADLLVQRRTGSGSLETETRRRIHFVNAALKGTVFYQSYSSPQGNNTGAVLKIAPGATSPTIAVQPSGKCTVCHSVNQDGSRLISNTSSGPGLFNDDSRRYDLTTAGPSPTVLNTYAGYPWAPWSNSTSVVDKTGSGPSVTLSGIPSDDHAGSITVTVGGARGTARFNWDIAGLASTVKGTNVLTASSVALTGSGLTAAFATGTYVVGTTYRWSGAKASPSAAVEHLAQVLGDRYTFGGPWRDGSLYMTHGGRGTGNVGVGDPNFHAPPDYSNLFAVNPDSASEAPLTVTGWPSNMLAVTPRFSADGTKLAFGFWGGDALSKSPSGTLTQVSAGTRLAAVGFTCASPPCTSASAGWAVSNARDLTPGVTQRVAWPAFTPSGNAVVYQRQYRTSMSRTELGVTQTGSGPAVTFSGNPTLDGNGLITISLAGARGSARFNWTFGSASGSNVVTNATVTLGTTGITAAFPTGTYVLGTTYAWSGADMGVLGPAPWGQFIGWSPSHLNTGGGALAELWMSNVPANSSTSAVPTRLNNLNGLNASGTSYLPTASRLVAPAQNTYHAANGSFTIYQADDCSNTGTTNRINDYQMNYLPTADPIEAGGFVWVLFTSRRMFGNVAYRNSWEGEPSNAACFSSVPPTKKLWVAAIDTNFTPGTDPSHPAFYLPGQELAAGNSDGTWVNSSCAGLGTSCTMNDDCCNGSGASATVACRITSTASFPPPLSCQLLTACSIASEPCTTTADCCTGLTCPTGGGVCVNAPPIIYEPHSLTREYTATCPAGTQVSWRLLEWQATVPTGTSIGFSVQSKQSASDSYKPASPVGLSTATPASGTGPGTWYRGPDLVNTVLKAAGVAPGPFLLLTMDFKPTSSKTPVLHQWRQIFDCLPAQ